MSTPKRLRNTWSKATAAATAMTTPLKAALLSRRAVRHSGSLVHSLWRRMDERLQARKYQGLQD